MRRRSSIALPNFGVRRGSNASNSSAALKDEIVKDIFHVGLVNLGNSCFYNTIVQSLTATQPLTDIILAAPESSPALQALSPTSPSYNPDLDHLASPLPMTAALLVLLNKLDPTNNEDGTMGKKAFNPKSLLRQLSMKYDEYAEATQQDSHELLRHLIDGIMMEEQDLIKKLSALPPSHSSAGLRRPSMHLRSETVKAVVDSSGQALVPEDAISESSASVHGNETEEEQEDEGSSSDSDGESSSSEEEGEEQKKRRKSGMRPFVGSVFEGKLASFIICDECKTVSLTKEDFMDLSLSLKDEQGNKMRKRDRIRRTLQSGFFSRKSGRGSGKESGDDVQQAPNGIPRRTHSSLSEAEGGSSPSEADETDDEHIRPAHLHNGSANGGPSTSRHNSLDPSKLSRESTQSLRPPEASGTSHRSASNPSSRPSRDPSPLGRALSVLSRGSDQSHHHFHRRPKIPKPTAAQIAYIKQVLVDVPAPAAQGMPPGLRVARPPGSTAPQPSSPSVDSTSSSLSNLRLNGSSSSVDWQNTDLYDCFRQFTSVEVLEGENSFACRNCWKWLNPELEAQRKEEKERKKAERKLKRAARAQSMPNGGIRAAVQVDGEGRVLRPSDHNDQGMVESEDEDGPAGTDGDLTARNTPAASPRAMPTITTKTPDASIPSIEPLPSAMSPIAASPQTVTAKVPSRSFSVSSKATNDTAASADDEGGISSEAIDTTTDEEDNDDSPDPDTTSLSGSSHLPPLTVENVGALPPASSGNRSDLSISFAAARPTTASSLDSHVPTAGSVSPARSPSATGAPGKVTKPPPKTQRHILRRAHKRYLISPTDLPPVLVIHLKRFMQTNKSSLFGSSSFVNLKKKDDVVTFPKEMDLEPFLAPKGKPPKNATGLGGEAEEEEVVERGRGVEVPEEAIEVEKEEEGGARYRLYAVVVHEGTIDTGHYASFVLTNRYGKGTDAGKGERRWVFCSDEDVMAVSEAEVLRSKAYMLFYERISTASTTAGSISGSNCSVFLDSPKMASTTALQPPPSTLPDVIETPATPSA
ncbi:hypothetical protein JCM11641_006287 [Rhodosporidiobolus odoratus]